MMGGGLVASLLPFHGMPAVKSAAGIGLAIRPDDPGGRFVRFHICGGCQPSPAYRLVTDARDHRDLPK